MPEVVLSFVTLYNRANGAYFDMIIDSHIHLYPDDIALRAHQKLAKAGAINDFTVGSYQNLCKVMDEGGIDRVIVQNIATGPEDVADVNAFALSIKDKRIFSFATLHPFEDKCLGRIAQYKKQGFLGVKLHPYFQHFDIADERLLPVYATLERENLPLLIHAGRDFTYKDIVLAAPKTFMPYKRTFLY